MNMEKLIAAKILEEGENDLLVCCKGETDILKKRMRDTNAVLYLMHSEMRFRSSSESGEALCI
jgi:hypothetical protein